MPEGSMIVIGFGLMVTAAFASAVYCLLLAGKYRQIECDMRCVHNGEEKIVMDIIYNRNDWFMRSVRLHSEAYPYYEDVLISDVRASRPPRSAGKRNIEATGGVNKATAGTGHTST